MKEYDELTNEQRKQVDRYTAANCYNWYAVVYTDAKVKLMREAELSNILQGGQPPENFGIVFIVNISPFQF